MLRGRVDREVVVELRGGLLEIGWADKNSPVLMTGPAATVFTGEWPLEERLEESPMFEGIHTALITPFRNGQVDEEALRAHVERQIEAGVDGVVPCGSTGESATLSHLEHRRVVEIVVDAAKGRVPVIAGTGSNATREAIELTLHAKQAGADGCAPALALLQQADPGRHLRPLCGDRRGDALPARPLQHPGPHGVEHRARDHRAARAPRAHRRRQGGLGQPRPDGPRHREVPAADFAVLSGDDSLTLPLLAIGGKGVISTTSNVAPRQICDLVRRFQQGDLAGAQAIHYALLPLFDVLFCETNPIPVKAAASAARLVQPRDPPAAHAASPTRISSA